MFITPYKVRGLMQQIELSITNRLGLHARAASRFVDSAKHFQSAITLSVEGKEVDGKSIMKLLLLGAQVETKIIMRIEGPDESEALSCLRDLINAGFGELCE
jgi:phosphocarrier protein